MYGIAVIGGGPAGLRLSARLQKQGFDTVVVEEHGEIGKPVHCSGLISKSGAAELRLNLDSVAVNEVRGAKMFSPGGEQLVVKRGKGVAYVIDRERFDKQLQKEAAASGAEIMLGTKMLDIRGETVFIKRGNRGEMLKAKITVGADGASSRVREIMGLGAPQGGFVNSCQARVSGDFDADFVELHFSSRFAPGFFAWVIPESRQVARIGTGAVGKNPKECLGAFLEKLGMQNAEAIDETASIIPVGRPLEGLCRENMLLVGDAAFQAKATSGGGVIMGMNAAEACARTVVEYYKSKKPLAGYEKNLSELNKELNSHWKVRSYLNSLSDRQVDGLFAKLRKAGIEEFLEKEGDMDRPSRFLSKLLFKPKMWGLMPEFIGFLRR